MPILLLCKSHTCKNFDGTNIRTLTNIEITIGLQAKTEKGEPALKSCICQKKCVAGDVVILALLKLVSRDVDDFILEKDNKHKTYSLYKDKDLQN